MVKTVRQKVRKKRSSNPVSKRTSSKPITKKSNKTRKTKKTGDGPLFVIDNQELGIEALVEYNLCATPSDVKTIFTWEQLQDITADIAEKGHKLNGFYGKSAIQIVLYGPAGVGKSSFASYFPANTVVFDSLTGFEKQCFHYHCNEQFEGDWSKTTGFYSYSKGPKQAAKTDWPEWLDGLNAIREAGINVVLIAHSSPPKEYNNPDGPNYDRHNVYLDKETWSQTHRWSRANLFYNYHVEVDKREGRAKGTSEERQIYTQWSPAFDAKNQYALEPIIEAGSNGQEAFEAFAAEFK